MGWFTRPSREAGDVWAWGDDTYRGPVRLFPFRMMLGERDKRTAEAVMHNMVETTPPTEIPLNVLTNAKMKRCLHNLGVTTA